MIPTAAASDEWKPVRSPSMTGKRDKGDKVKRHEKHGRHTSEAANGGHRGGDDHGGLKRFAGKRFAACLRDAV